MWEPLTKFMSSKHEWTWTNIYENLYERDHQKEYNHGILQQERAATLKNRCIRCQFQSRSSARDGQNAGSKEKRTPGMQLIAFVSKSVTSGETHYSNIERGALGIPHGLEKFHHYCFTHDVNFQEWCNKNMTQIAKNVVTHSPTQHKNPV